MCEGVPRARQRNTPAQVHRVGAQTARRRRRDGGSATRSRRVLSGGAVRAAASPVSLGPVEDFGCTRCHLCEAPSIRGDDTLACGHATCASGARRVDQGRATADSLQTVESRTRVWSNLIGGPKDQRILARGQHDGAAGGTLVAYDHPSGGLVVPAGFLSFGRSLAVDPIVQRIAHHALNQAARRAAPDRNASARRAASNHG